MEIKHVKASEFNNEVLKADKPVLVDFWADWCGPCKMLGPVLEQVAAKVDDVQIVKINVDEILKFLSVMTGDSRYEEILSDKEGVSNMCDVAQRLEDRGIEKGIKEGLQKGMKEGLSLGGNQMIYSLVEDKSISIEKGAQKLGISVEKLRANMINAGYKCSDME